MNLFANITKSRRQSGNNGTGGGNKTSGTSDSKRRGGGKASQRSKIGGSTLSPTNKASKKTFAAGDAVPQAGRDAPPTSTADLLREAQKARVAAAAHRRSSSIVALPTGPGGRAAGGRTETSVAESMTNMPPAVVAMRSSMSRSTRSFSVLETRYDTAQQAMIRKGRSLSAKKNQRSGSTTSTSPSHAQMETSTLSASETREFICAAINDELQAEFRDITLRRDSQRSFAENQEHELDEMRQDMKRLTSGSDATRDEAAAQLQKLILRRERSQSIASNGLAGFAPPALNAAPSASPFGVVVAPSKGNTPPPQHLTPVPDEEDEFERAAQRATYVERQHIAVQVEEDARAKTHQVSAEHASQMEDLYKLEKMLLLAVRRLMVAVAHVLLFHDAISVELTCKRCLNMFEVPEVLWPCGHVFCHACLAFMYDHSSEMIICCECGVLTDVGFTPEPVLTNLTLFQQQFLEHSSFAHRPQPVPTPSSTTSNSSPAGHKRDMDASFSHRKPALQDVLRELLAELGGDAATATPPPATLHPFPTADSSPLTASPVSSPLSEGSQAAAPVTADPSTFL
jgi:hypothetical protein